LSTISDDAWIRKQVCNLWLDGHSQEHISTKLEISVGTVNKMMQDLTRKDKQLVLMREISLSAMKNDIDIPQIAANLRYENAVKRLGLDNDKLEICLRALGSILSENEVTPKIFSSLFYDICYVILREKKSLSQTADEVKSRNTKLSELDLKIEEKKKMIDDAELLFKRTMESNNLSIEKMKQIIDMKAELEVYGISFDEIIDLLSLLRNIRVLGGDPYAIVSKYSEIALVETEVTEIQKKYQELWSMIEDLDKYAGNKKQAVKILIRLCQRRITEQDLLNVLDTIEQHTEHMTILQLRELIDACGSLSTVKFRLLVEQIRLESQNRMLKNSNHTMSIKERSYLADQEIHAD
jgi:hypothetical protein